MAKEDEKQSAFMAQLGSRLKAIRKAKGYTSYEKFAVQNDISRMQYWRYEKGEDMRISSLKKIVSALGMTMEEFFQEGFDSK